MISPKEISLFGSKRGIQGGAAKYHNRNYRQLFVPDELKNEDYSNVNSDYNNS